MLEWFFQVPMGIRKKESNEFSKFNCHTDYTIIIKLVIKTAER